MQINLTGFLNGKNARVFMTDLWELLLSAQESPSGIPPKFIEQKKEELKKKMVGINFFNILKCNQLISYYSILNRYKLFICKICFYLNKLMIKL